MRIIHRVTASLPNSVTIATKFCPRWSGILVVDGKVIRVYDHMVGSRDRTAWTDEEWRWRHKMRWLCGVDYGTGDLPHYALADSENKIDLVTYFRILKSIGYPLHAVVCDGNPIIPEAARFIYGAFVIVQRCTRHFIEDLKRLLPPDEHRAAERIQLLGLIYRIQNIIETETLASAAEHCTEYERYVRTCHGTIATIIRKSFRNTVHDLTAHLRHPHLSLPHTTNDAENLFKQLMLRLKSIGRFHHQDYARDYLNAWALLRRFTPFTDCCKGRHHRNGKAPLGLAGCTITNIDPLKLSK